jgi:hypothetical protein
MIVGSGYVSVEGFGSVVQLSTVVREYQRKLVESEQ